MAASMASSSVRLPRGEVKAFPAAPPNVALAFEKLQVPCLLSKLQGGEAQQREAINLLLEIWLDPVRTQEGLKQGCVEILIFLLRTATVRGKLAEALRKLAAVAGGRKEL